jgi:hypothetical protein
MQYKIFVFRYSNILHNNNNAYNDEVEILLHHLIYIYISLYNESIYIYIYTHTHLCRPLFLSHKQKVVDNLLISSSPSSRKQNANWKKKTIKNENKCDKQVYKDKNKLTLDDVIIFFPNPPHVCLSLIVIHLLLSFNIHPIRWEK